MSAQHLAGALYAVPILAICGLVLKADILRYWRNIGDAVDGRHHPRNITRKD